MNLYLLAVQSKLGATVAAVFGRLEPSKSALIIYHALTKVLTLCVIVPFGNYLNWRILNLIFEKDLRTEQLCLLCHMKQTFDSFTRRGEHYIHLDDLVVPSAG